MHQSSFLGTVSLAVVFAVALSGCSEDSDTLNEATSTDQPVITSDNHPNTVPSAEKQASTMDVKTPAPVQSPSKGTPQSTADSTPESASMLSKAEAMTENTMNTVETAAKNAVDSVEEKVDSVTESLTTSSSEASEVTEVVEVVEPVTASPSGSDLYATCVGCHGANGEGGVGPKLAGQSKDDLVALLQKYKAGEQVGAMSAMMIPNAQQLSDDDIVIVSEYITTFK
ncbi:MAG: c-type cytochrome [Hydrogenovibrio sp.]